MSGSEQSERVLVLAPTAKDAELCRGILSDARIVCQICPNLLSVCTELSSDAGAVLLPEESLTGEGMLRLEELLRAQASWSDIPILVFATGGANSPLALKAVESLGNVTLLERPLRMTALLSAVQSALRARRRQYELREQLEEHTRAEEALRDSDRRKDQFLATLAHELRNPLAPISNALQLWRLVENDPEETEELRGLMERQVKQMTHLIDELLDVSRISRGRIQLQKQKTDLATIIGGAVEAVQPFIDACGHDLAVILPAEPVWLDCDVSRLMQVFGNLLHNAAKYTPRKGHIWVTAKREGENVRVSVRDNGAGIPAEMLSEIFDMFTQVDQTLDKSHGGLGIGLTLVKSLVELHGGSVEARSAGPGQGSELIVSLPAVSDESVRRPGSRRYSFQRKLSLPRHRILVVDDVKASAETVGMMLKALGQDIRVEFDGPSAIAAVLEFRPEVVLLDIAMPGMDGYEVARRLRKEFGGAEPVLVALTGFGQEEDRRQAFAAGFNHHMVKPLNLETFEEVLLTVPSSADGDGRHLPTDSKQ